MPDQHEPESQLQKAQDAIDEARDAAAAALPEDDLPAPSPDAETSDSKDDSDIGDDSDTEIESDTEDDASAEGESSTED